MRRITDKIRIFNTQIKGVQEREEQTEWKKLSENKYKLSRNIGHGSSK